MFEKIPEISFKQLTEISPFFPSTIECPSVGFGISSLVHSAFEEKGLFEYRVDAFNGGR